jgi:uncharacterized protein YdaU (DUF1376 family)
MYSENKEPRLPYFKHYKGDDMLDTSTLSIEAIGVYHLLQVQYFNLGGLPREEREIRRLARMEKDRRWPKICDELTKGKRVIFKPGWIKPEWDELVEEMHTKSDKARASVGARYRHQPAQAAESELESIPF